MGFILSGFVAGASGKAQRVVAPITSISRFTKIFTAACLVGTALGASAQDAADVASAQALAQALAAELNAACPLADPSSQAAYDACRQPLFSDSQLKHNLDTQVLWGRQAAEPSTSLKASGLTQFSPDIWTGMYASLFMFDGSQRVEWVEKEKMFRIQLGATFRNRLAPGEFPYPFWHDANKWSAYENANSLLLWYSPKHQKIKVAQFTWQDGPLAGVAVKPVTHDKFDGKWVWTDKNGVTQPVVTVFDGLYSSNNPYKAQLDKDYKALAVSLRDNQCLQCHSPDNKDHSKRLVLLQSPAHASGEIVRLLKTIRNDRMPLDEIGIAAPLDADAKRVLLDLGGVFERTVVAAKNWEDNQQAQAKAVVKVSAK